MDDLAKRPHDQDPLDLGFTRLWQEIDRFFSQAMKVFSETANTAGADFTLGKLFPQIEVARQGEEIVATVDVPGLRPDSLEVSVSAENLTVRGEAETRDEGFRSYRSFYRMVPLPARVRPEAARTEQRDSNRLVVRVPVA